MSTIICSFCKTPWREDERGCCNSCGSWTSEEVKENRAEWTKSDPFIHDDLIVYQLKNEFSFNFTYRFYKGTTLVGDVHISRREAEEFVRENGYAVDPMPWIMEKFRKGDFDSCPQM